MGLAIIRQGDQQRISLQQFAVELDAGNTATNAMRILDGNLVPGGMVAENDFEVSPALWNAGINVQSCPTQMKSEYPLESRPIHPSGRAGVPSPAAAPNMCWFVIYVAAGNVRLNLVAVNAGTRARVIDRVQERQQLAGLVALA